MPVKRLCLLCASCGDHLSASQGGREVICDKNPAVLLMGLHIIKPLGLPGLKRRGDFWKIAAIAILVMALAVGFHLHEG